MPRALHPANHSFAADRTVASAGRSSAHHDSGWLRLAWMLAPVLIIAAGLALRLYGYDFDDGQMLHPDELAIDQAVVSLGCCLGKPQYNPWTWPSPFTHFFDARLAPYDPHFFNYGSLPLYLLAIVTRMAAGLGQVIPALSSWRVADSLAYTNWIGRWLSALFDAGSLALLYRIGRRVFDREVALLGLTLAAFTVLSIQLSHFYAVDTMLTFFVLLTLWGAVGIAGGGSWRWYLLAGSGYGAALATKTSAFPLVVPIAVAAVVSLVPEAKVSETYDRLLKVLVRAGIRIEGGFARSPSVGDAHSVPRTMGLGNAVFRPATRLGHRLGSAALASVLRKETGETRNKKPESVASRPSGPHLHGVLVLLLATFLLAAAVFVIAEPYGIIDHTQLLADVQEQNGIIVSHTIPVPYTIQFVGTLPYLYSLRNLVLWYMGPALGISACVGTIWLVARNLLGRFSGPQAVLLTWVIPYFLIVGHFWAQFGRYLLPVLPLLSLFAAALLIEPIRRLRGRWTTAARAAAAIVVICTVVWALAFMHIYTVTDTQVAATEWIHTHLRPTTPFATEGAWDRSLPLCLPQPGQCPAGYNSFPLNLYDPDDAAKLDRLVYAVTHDDFIVMSSQRFFDSIPKEPTVYPLTNRYYHLLFHGRLNFRLVKQFEVRPQIGPWVIDDAQADENFTVFDHPVVRIFERDAAISVRQARLLLKGRDPPSPRSRPEPGRGSRPMAAAPPPIDVVAARQDHRLMLTPAEWEADQQAPTYDQMFPPHGFGMSHPLVVWLTLVELLGLAMFPVTAFVFSGLSDRGWVVAKTVGLISAGWLIWASVELGLARYTATAIWVTLGALLALAAVSWPSLGTVRQQLIPRLGTILGSEAVFLAGFAAFVLLRMWYPDLGHQFSPVSHTNVGAGRMGEKQMELAFLSAITRSQTFPPLDPFFAGGFINYYYFGYVIVATLCKATTIAPTVGFNLAIATFFGLLLGTAYSIGRSATRSALFGVVTAVFVGCIGNLNGLVQVVQDLQAASQIHSALPLMGGLIDTLDGLAQAVVYGHRLAPFDFWASTRLIPPLGTDFAEFPFFTYLFADLHSHLMAFPMDLAVVALSLSCVLAPSKLASWRGVVTTAGIGALLLGAIQATNPLDFPTYLIVLGMGLAIALLVRPAGGARLRRCGRVRSTSNQIPAPTEVQSGAQLSRSFATVAPSSSRLSRAPARDPGRPSALSGAQTPGRGEVVSRQHLASSLLRLAVALALTAIMAVVLLPPTLQGYHPVFDTGLALVAAQASTVRLALLGTMPPSQLSNGVHDVLATPLPVYWEMLGLFLFLVLTWLAVRSRLSALPRNLRRSRRLPALVLSVAVVVALLAANGLWLLAFLAATASLWLVATVKAVQRRSCVELWLLALFGLALTLSVFCEVFFIPDYLRNGLAFRMNTVAKIYNQIWVLDAIAAAGCARLVMRAARAGGRLRQRETVGEPPRYTSRLKHPQTLSRTLRRHPLWASALGILVAGSLIYTYAGTVSRETMRQTWLPPSSVPLTLDGMAFMRAAYPDDYAGVSWLNAHVRGTPTILEADQADYNWRSRVVQFTGLPTLFGGIYEPAQRYDDEVAPRQAVLEEIYAAHGHDVTRSVLDEFGAGGCPAGTPVAARCLAVWLLRRYRVSYVYVGLMEEQLWPAGVAKFDRMADLQRVFHRGDVSIYHVRGAET